MLNVGNINTNEGELNLTSSAGFVRFNNLSIANLNAALESNGENINIMHKKRLVQKN